MLSKNNTDQYTEKLAPKRQKFAIKKFTVGVASVLVGMTFALYAGSSQALADQANTETSQQVTGNDQVQKPADTPATVTETEKVQKSATDQAPQTNLETSASNEVPQVHAEPDNSVTPQTQPESTASNVASQASSDTTDNDPSSQTPDPQVETPSQTASHVSDMLQLQTALNDKNVSEIVLDKDVVNNTDNYVGVDKTGSARKVTVWGSKVDDDKTTSLNLGDYSLYFYNKTATTDHKWDLNFKNINVSTNDPKGYGVVSFQNNGTGAKVAFDNVLAGGNGVLVYAPNADVSLRDTVVTPTYVESSLGANVTANTVGLSGKVTLTSEVNNAKSTSQNIYADGKVTVNSGANVVLTTNNSKSNQLQNLTAGSLEVKEGAKLSVKANTTAPNVGVPWGSWSGLVENSGAVYVTDGNAKVDGELTVDATTKDKNSTSVVAAVVLGASANTQNDLVVGPTGKLVVNATTAPNTRGVYFVNNNHAFGMQKGAKATFKMGHGVSNAVFDPDNLVLNEGAKLVVETYQDNNGVTNPGFDANAAGAHSGVITLDLNSSNRPNNSEVTVGNVHGALMVKKDALLKVVRKVDDATKQAATPLLSFGGTGGNNGTNSLDVDHGSVVLEDALQKDSLTHSNLGYYSYLGITDSEHSPIYPLGMVSMWGVGSTDRVNVVAPKLFKMERTGKQKGMLFRLEATDNKITVTADDEKSVPVKYGTLGNVRYNNNTVSQAKNYQWDVEKIKSVNRLGDYSMNYLNGDTSGTPFGLSPESSVSFKQKTPQEAKNDFNNYFNWWSATDLEMGSDLKVYSPFYRPLVVMKNETRSEVVTYQGNDQPSSATYKLFDKNDGLSWVKVDTTGKVTVAPTDTTSLGLHNVSVEASFDNGQKVVTYVPVMVLDNDQKVVFNGENMLVGKTEPVLTHKTSDKNLVLDPVQAVNSLTVYTRDAATGKYLETAKYTPNSEGNFTEKTTGKVLSGVKVTWVKVPTTVVPKDSSDTETSTVSAAVNVVDQEVDFPKAGTFPDLGALPVVVTMYGASAKPDVSATSDLPQTLPQAQSVVSMPELTEKHHAAVADVSWKTKPDLTRPESQVSGVVKVDFVDGTKLEVPVSVEVKPNMAELNVPVGQDVYTPLDTEPVAEKGVANVASMPTGTKYSWKNPVNVYTLGEKPGKVVVTYPDGTKDELSVRVLVTDPNADQNKVPADTPDVNKYAPQGQEVTTVQGKTPQAEEGVSNKSELPKETKYAWKAPLDVSRPGKQQGTVVVTYPDDSQAEVPVKVVVTKAPEKEKPDAEKYAPQGQEVTTEQGQTPQAKAGVSNKSELPKDTKYDWKAPLNVTQPGEQQGTVVVTYPDGSQAEVPVKVVVTKAPKKMTDAEKYAPQGQEVTTVQGQTPQAEAGVSNKSELPKDTKYGWKTPLNVTQSGEQQGTVVVTYPDGSQAEVPVKVVVTKAPKKMTDAEKYAPQGQEVTTVQGKTPQAEEGVSNKSELPKDTKYDWKTPLNVTQSGAQQGTVVVTYPDGSQDEVPVKVVVTKALKKMTDAEKYTPQSQEVTTVQGQTPQAEAGVSNKTDLPKDTKYSWKTPLDVSKVGEVQNTVVVTYPDGSQDEVPVKVVVTKAPEKEKTDAEKYAPQGQEVTTVQGQTPQAEAGVSNKTDLPKDTKYSWKTPLDVSKVGEVQNTVVVTYPDGSQDEVPVKVVVTKAPEKEKPDAEKYAPQGQEVTTEQGQTPQAEAGVSNKADLPKDTKYSWKTPLDVSKVGETQNTVVVTYPDGSQDEVPVKVVVTKAPKKMTDAEKYAPQGQEVTTVQGQTPQAKAGVSNKSELPKDTKYDWKTPLNVTQSGAQQGTVVVTYPDGSQDEVPVKVVVTKAPKKMTDAEKYTPQSQEVRTPQDQTPQAEVGVSNKSELPKDTKYDWKTPLNVTQSGAQQGTVVVTYPDGSQDEVPVKVVVTKAPKKMTDAEKYAPQGQEVTTVQGQTPQAKAGVSNKSELPKDTKYDWKTPLNVTQSGAQQGTVVVTYPDGSQDEVPVKVVVTKAPEKEKPDAEKYAPQGQEVTTVQGQVPQAKAGVSNKSDLPKGTKYSWKTPVDVSKVGEVQNTVVVTYPDGSQDELPVKVVVTKTPEKEKTDAEKYVPQGQNVRTVQDKMPRAEAGVSNKSELPKGTKYSWKTPLDVSTLGKHQGTVVVTYPDSSQAEVSVTVEVDVWKNGAKTMQVNDLLSKSKIDKGNADKNAHMLKESLPQTGEDDEKKTLFVGTLLTLVAGMLGSELLNKKHTKDQK